METKEDILDKYTEGRKGIYDNEIQISFEDALKAMQEYADQQTEQLKKEIEYLKRVNSRQSETIEKGIQNYIEQIEELTLLGASAEKQVIDLQSQLSEKDKELSELKAKHEKDVKKAWQKGSESWIRGAQTAEQYYTQTHGQ